MTKLKEIIEAAKQEFTVLFKENPEYPEDLCHELADSSTPIYSHDLMILSSDPDIFFHENELSPAFTGEPTLNNITATAVYELVSNALFELLYELQSE